MATAKQTTPGYEDVVREIMSGKFHPVYCLMGEEDYYIDKISDLLVEKLLTPDEQAFNLFTFYAIKVVACCCILRCRVLLKRSVDAAHLHHTLGTINQCIDIQTCTCDRQ